MKIDDAVKALEQGKTVNSANAAATIKPYEAEGQKRVKVTRQLSTGEDVMDMALSRMRQIYRGHDFAEGDYKMTENKAAKVPETK